MPVLGRATLELNADSAKLEQDLGRSVQQAAAFGTMVGEVLGHAIARGTEKLIGLIDHAIDAGDELNKLSQKTGMSVGTLSELRVAAELANVSLATLKTGVTQLYQNLSTAGRVDGKAKSAFEAIGLDIEKLRELKPDELFRAVTEQLAKYEDGANRAAIQTAIFGRSGAELSPLINELGKTTALARELGITMDKETAEAAERFKDNLTVGKIATEALGQRIAVVLLPTLEKLSGFLVSNAKDTERLDTVARAADAGLKLLATGASIVASAFEIGGGQIGRMAAIISAVAGGDFKAAAELYKSTWGDIGTQLGEAAAKVSLIWEETGNQVQAGAERNGAKLAAPVLNARDKILRARREIDAEFQAFLKMQQIDDEAAAATQNFYRRQGQEKEAAAAQAARDHETMMKQVYEFEDAQAKADMETEQSANNIGEKIKKTDDAARQLGITFSSAFEDAVVGGKKLSDVLRGLGDDITKIVLRKTVTEPIAGAFSGWLNDLGKGGAAGGGLLSSIGSWFSGLFGGGKAGGGPLDPGKWYIAGERGPEPIWGGGPGAFAAGYGGEGAPAASPINVQMHVYGVTDARSFRASTAQIAGDLARVLGNARRNA